MRGFRMTKTIFIQTIYRIILPNTLLREYLCLRYEGLAFLCKNMMELWIRSLEQRLTTLSASWIFTENMLLLMLMFHTNSKNNNIN